MLHLEAPTLTTQGLEVSARQTAGFQTALSEDQLPRTAHLMIGQAVRDQLTHRHARHSKEDVQLTRLQEVHHHALIPLLHVLHPAVSEAVEVVSVVEEAASVEADVVAASVEEVAEEAASEEAADAVADADKSDQPFGMLCCQHSSSKSKINPIQ